jgi:hypothetical protein
MSETVRIVDVYCPKCKEKQWSIFDRTFTEMNRQCVDCTPADDLEKKSEKVFEVVGRN